MTELEKYKGLFLDATKQGGLYRERLEKVEAEWQKPDDVLLRIGAPAVPFLEQVEWMRKRLAAIEEAAREVMGLMPQCGHSGSREYCLSCAVKQRLAKVLERT